MEREHIRFSSLSRGSAYVVKGDSAAFLYLDNVGLADPATDWCEQYWDVRGNICFIGNSDETLHVFLKGQNILIGEGIRASWSSKQLSIHGPGSLAVTGGIDEAVIIASKGDLWIGEGAVLSIVGNYGGDASSGLYAAHRMSIVNSAISIIQNGVAGGAAAIQAEDIEITGAVISGCSALGDSSSYWHSAMEADNHVFLSHSSVTLLSSGGGIATKDLTVDTSALGILGNHGPAISAKTLQMKNVAGTVISGSNGIEAHSQEYRAGNNLTIMGGAWGKKSQSAICGMKSSGLGWSENRNASFKHSGGKTTLFAPNGTGIDQHHFLDDHKDYGSGLNCVGEVSGGTLAVSSKPGWKDARKFFTAASIATAAESVLQGKVSESVTLSLLENFFASEAISGITGLLTKQVSSAKPVCGICSDTFRFSGGKTSIDCQTDAAAIRALGSATRKGGTVTVNGKSWPFVTLKVSFNPNGGTVSVQVVSVKSGAAIGKLPTPKRKDYVFVGWFTAKSGGTKVTAKTTFSKNTTVYAHWAKRTYTVAFSPNGGTGTMASQAFTYGKAAKLRKNAFKRKGYTFAGWAKTKNGAVAYANAASVKNLRSDGKTTTLYAKWKATKYKIAFDPNGGTGTMAKQSMTYGKAAKLRKNAFKRKGYTFAGWAKTKKGTVAYANAASVKNLASDGKTVTLYAKWKATKYKIAFDPNGGTGTMASQAFTYGKASKLRKNAFKRKRYTFAGWAKTKNGPVVYPDAASVKNLSSDGTTVTLYAQWTGIPCMLSFNANGGSVTPSSKAVPYGQPAGTLPVPTCNSHAFLGWYTSADGGDRITSSLVITANRTVHAHWMESVPLPEALDETDFVFTTGGATPWFGQKEEAFDGEDAARSGPLENGQSSWMQTTVPGAGTISFWWRTSGGTAGTGSVDCIEFIVDGIQKARIQGTNVYWSQVSMTVAENGRHVLKWNCQKNGTVSDGNDCGWVDRIEWTNRETVDGTTWLYTVENGKATVTGAETREKDWRIPDSLGGCPVTSIGEYAFGDDGGTQPDHLSFTWLMCLNFQLTSVQIPNSVTNIGGFAFAGCTNLSRVTIGNGVREIGRGAFARCAALVNVIIPGNVAALGEDAFYHCTGLRTATILGSVTNDWYLDRTHAGIEVMWPRPKFKCTPFCSCSNLETIILGDKMAKIGLNMFHGCTGLKSLSIGNNVTNILGNAFSECEMLSDISVGAANPSYACVGGVLYSKDMSTLLVCSRGKTGSFSVPDGVVLMDWPAFQYCKNLTSLTIPDSVTGWKNSLRLLGDRFVAAFDGCSNLKTLSLPAAWKETTNLENAGVPEGCTVVYRTAKTVIPAKGLAAQERIVVAAAEEALPWIGVTASGGENADAVADGDENTAWMPETPDGSWVVLTFDAPRDVENVEVVGDNLPAGTRFLLSEDADNWQEGVPGSAQYVWVVFPPGDEPLAIREIRVLGSDSAGWIRTNGSK